MYTMAASVSVATTVHPDAVMVVITLHQATKECTLAEC